MDQAKLKAPEGVTGCSWNGKEFTVTKKGFVTVPVEAVADLAHHGFVATESAEDQPAE